MEANRGISRLAHRLDVAQCLLRNQHRKWKGFKRFARPLAPPLGSHYHFVADEKALVP